MEKKRCIETIANLLDKDNLIIYLGNNVSLDSQVDKAVLLVTHEFTRTGAPTMMLEMARVLLERGNSVWCLCHKEDVLMEQYIEQGVNVIIYEKYKDDSRWLWQIRNIFDLWCLNTLLLFDVFEKLNNTSQNVVLWIHENEYHFKTYEKKIRNVKVGMNSKILAAGPYVKKLIKKYMEVDAEILNFGLEDAGIKRKVRKKDDTIKFLQVGTIDGNKGQGVLADAVELLDEETMRKAEFVLCGDRKNAVGSELFKIDRAMSKYDNFILIPTLERSELYRLYEEIDAVIVPSKEETTSAIMVEAMMKGIPGICSDGCGITHYMEDGKNGFVFNGQNAEELAKKIIYVVNNINKMDAIKKEGRKVYEEVYSREIFRKNIIALLKWAEEGREYVKNNVLSSINACSGCGSCALECPVSAITMLENERGFLYPNIDDEKCIHCENCISVCAANNNVEPNPMQQEIYAVKVKDEQQRMQSQSGGAFAIMAEKILDKGALYMELVLLMV